MPKNKDFGPPPNAMFRMLVDLRQAAGWPISRVVADRTGGAVAPPSVDHVYEYVNLPRWPTCRAITVALGGDWLEVFPLWRATYNAVNSPPSLRADVDVLSTVLVDLLVTLDLPPGDWAAEVMTARIRAHKALDIVTPEQSA
jgi:hypothetical protein